jgi:hypothetical protein
VWFMGKAARLLARVPRASNRCTDRGKWLAAGAQNGRSEYLGPRTVRAMGKTRRGARMQAAEKQPEREGVSAATRLRLLSLSTPAGPVEFGGGLACIRTPPDTRPAIADAIARAVIGPRPADVDGTLDIAGRLVALQSLPAPLLLPGAASTVDRSLLGELGRRGRAQRRADVQAAHAARRLERHRTEAEVDRAHERAESLAARMAIAAEQAPPPEPEAAAPGMTPDEVTPRLEAMLGSLRALHPVPSADALAVADAFEELAATSPPWPEPVDVDLVGLERQVADARVAIAHAAPGVSPAARARVEECQRVVVESEGALFEASRTERPGSLFKYQEALSAARTALSEAGVDSYASFLAAVGGESTRLDLEARLRAELELAQAEAALDHARVLVVQKSAASLRDKELDLRARAALILGRFLGADPVAELRAVRVEHPAAADLRRALQRELEALGVPVGDDVVATAQSTIDARRAAPPPEPPRPEPPAPRRPVVDPADEKEQRALEAEMRTLLDDRAAHDAALAALESQLGALDGQAAPASEQVHVDAVTLALATMLDSYRSSELLAGRLPVVLDGAFDEIGAYASAAAAKYLAAVDDVQMIVVTCDEEIADAFTSVGAATSWWPVPDSDRPHAESSSPGTRPIPRVEAGSVVLMCEQHAAEVAAASCAHCTRGACLDCLVYMPAEAEIWCVTCAEGARSGRVSGLGTDR